MTSRKKINRELECMSDVSGVQLQNPPIKTKKTLHKTVQRVLGKIGVLMKNRTRAEIINNESDESMSIFNQERKEYFLEHLQESMLHHAAIRDRAEKLAVHMGISIGEAANQLKAHLVQEAAKRRKGNPFDEITGTRSFERIPDPLSKPSGKSTTAQIKSDIVDRTMRRRTMKKPILPGSITDSFERFINNYESVLAENGIEEYDLDEATEYFIEEILPQRQEKIINEGIEALLSEEMSVDEFVDYLEEAALPAGLAGRVNKDLHSGLSSAVEAHTKAAQEHETAKQNHEKILNNPSSTHKDIAASAANLESAAIKRNEAEKVVHGAAVDVVSHLRKSKGI